MSCRPSAEPLSPAEREDFERALYEVENVHGHARVALELALMRRFLRECREARPHRLPTWAQVALRRLPALNAKQQWDDLAVQAGERQAPDLELTP